MLPSFEKESQNLTNEEKAKAILKLAFTLFLMIAIAIVIFIFLVFVLEWDVIIPMVLLVIIMTSSGAYFLLKTEKIKD